MGQNQKLKQLGDYIMASKKVKDLNAFELAQLAQKCIANILEREKARGRHINNQSLEKCFKYFVGLEAIFEAELPKKIKEDDPFGGASWDELEQSLSKTNEWPIPAKEVNSYVQGGQVRQKKTGAFTPGS